MAIEDSISIEGIFEEAAKSRNRRLSSHFRPLVSRDPLEVLLRAHEKKSLARRAAFLSTILKKTLTLTQYAFIHRIAGADPDWFWKLPRDFRRLEDNEFRSYALAQMPEIKERINILLKDDGLTKPLPELLRFASIPYNLATRKEIIGVYEKVANGTYQSYPNNFFHPENSRIPVILMRYVVEGVIEAPRDELLLQTITPEVIRNHRLTWMIQQHYNGDIKAALQAAYSPLECPSLYVAPKKPDPLQEILAQWGI